MLRVGSAINATAGTESISPITATKGSTILYRRYCESMLAVDDSVGRVLEQLKKMGIHDDTLVIYMGDNGFMWGEHGLIDKRVSYEASIRVPMMMQCPDLYQGGKVVEQVIGNIDIGPTIMHAAGLQTPDYMDGMSFLDLPNKRPRWRDYFLYVYYWEKKCRRWQLTDLSEDDLSGCSLAEAKDQFLDVIHIISLRARRGGHFFMLRSENRPGSECWRLPKQLNTDLDVEYAQANWILQQWIPHRTIPAIRYNGAAPRSATTSLPLPCRLDSVKHLLEVITCRNDDKATMCFCRPPGVEHNGIMPDWRRTVRDAAPDSADGGCRVIGKVRPGNLAREVLASALAAGPESQARLAALAASLSAELNIPLRIERPTSGQEFGHIHQCRLSLKADRTPQ